ncbi:MAG: T9SS type A sorting domain-containing protein [Bacteroidales bacterium]|nr:T9SS type A sorting domain-containing protein [Bacteroidales bacterium]
MTKLIHHKLNSLGSKCISNKTTNENSITIDMSKLSKGIYLYKLLNTNNNTASFGKILKQ